MPHRSRWRAGLFCFLAYAFQQVPDGIDLVGVHGVAHARVDALVGSCPHTLEGRGRLLHALQRDVRVDVAAAQKHRRAFERAVVVAGRALRATETAGQYGEATVAARVARHELAGEAGALRETQQEDAFKGYPRAGHLLDCTLDSLEGRGKRSEERRVGKE